MIHQSSVWAFREIQRKKAMTVARVQGGPETSEPFPAIVVSEIETSV